MAYETGTATDYRNLLDKLRLFLTTNATLVGASQNWTQLRWSTTSTTQELILKAPGLGGTDEIYVGVASDENIASDWFNWHMNGYTGYDQYQTFFYQPGSINNTYSGMPCLNLWNSTIPYWFVADGRRCVIVVRVNTRYYIAHLGLLMPYGTPEQYPYPLCVMGNLGGSYYNSRWSSVTSGRSVYVLRGGTWVSTSKWPQAVNIGPSEDPVYPLLPITLYSPLNFNNITQRYEGFYYGEVDGVFACPGLNNVSENLIQVGGVDHLVIQDGSLTSLTDYWAVKLA